jgi:hypothetical protein
MGNRMGARIGYGMGPKMGADLLTTSNWFRQKELLLKIYFSSKSKFRKLSVCLNHKRIHRLKIRFHDYDGYDYKLFFF